MCIYLPLAGRSALDNRTKDECLADTHHNANPVPGREFTYLRFLRMYRWCYQRYVGCPRMEMRVHLELQVQHGDEEVLQIWGEMNHFPIFTSGQPSIQGVSLIRLLHEQRKRREQRYDAGRLPKLEVLPPRVPILQMPSNIVSLSRMRTCLTQLAATRAP
jgi:hypothetical protein